MALQSQMSREGKGWRQRGSKPRLQGAGWPGSVEEHRHPPTQTLHPQKCTGIHPHRPCTPKSAAQGQQGYDAASQAPTVPS